LAKKFAFIGAGSFGFTRKLVKDILSFPQFEDSTLALMDIDEERLDFIEQAVNKIVEQGDYPAEVVSTTDRKEALEGADGVVCTILVGGVDIWQYDITIPEKYGVDINVGDTRGPAGIFRALRTIPVMLDICRDIEELCPDALFLNYTNPMTMLCRAMRLETDVDVVGLCHSVQGTARMLADWIGASMEEVSYTCAGINHQAWFLRYERDGEDAYPQLREAMEDPEIYNEEIVRNEMFKHLDYYVTESSGHNSEYNPWFRKRPELIEKYCQGGTGWNPGEHAYILKQYREREDTWKDDIEEWLDQDEIDLERGHEYAASIFNAVFGDGQPFKFNGNVLNHGLIDNLPDDCCVEVPIFASPDGIDPIKVGQLPDQLALLNGINARCENMAVDGSLEGDRRKIFHAVAFDPLTSAVLSLEEIHDMVEEMFEANEGWLPQFE